MKGSGAAVATRIIRSRCVSTFMRIFGAACAVRWAVRVGNYARIVSAAIDATLFALFENKGVFALLLGSGLSRAAGIPTGWEITLDLIRRVALVQDAGEQPDWAEWYHQTTGQAPNYSTLLEELLDRATSGAPS